MARVDAQKHRIFVFGSNLAGRHGKGAALHAKENYGAISGKGIGHHGQSYAIPTKDSYLKTMSRELIDGYIREFLCYSMSNPRLEFNVTQIGCGLAGFKAHEIAPLFNIPPSARTNIWFDKAWEPYLLPGPTNFWEGPI